MKQTINKRLTIWLLTLILAVAALPALAAPAQAAEKTPVDVVFGSTTVKGEKENPYGTTLVHCENVTYTLENPNSNDKYYAAYTTWATGDVRIADTVEGLEVRKIRSSFFKEVTGNVTLGKNISSLDYSVFSGGKLREVTIPADSKLNRICQYAFRACPNLVRVGVGNTDKLPASLKIIDYYAFYESPAIKSIDLTQTQVKSIDDCTFTDCTALASVKLPNGLTSIGHSAFKGCTALKALDVPASVKFIGMDTFSYSGIMDLKLRCGAVSPAGMSIARSLLAMPDGAKVYLPKPSSAKYKDTMQFIYGNGQYTYCGANAKVKVYWMDGTAPVKEPSAKNNSVVTLSGKDKSGNTVPFNYDYTDADGDGLGAVIRLNGRQTGASLKLKLNGSGNTNNTTAVIFTRVRAYDYRHQGNIDSKAFSGKELTELLLRQQAVNYSSSASSSMSRDLNLALSNSDKLGLYYYIPTLVNEGSASKPMNAKTLPPVLVVYTPTSGTDEGVGLETSFGSSNKWFCGNGDKVDFNETGLSRAYPLYADGFEACFGTESGALTKGKAAYFDNGKNSITYQWKRVNKDGTSVLQTISASNYDYSKAGKNVVSGTAAATFNCYENVLPRGLQYCIGGLSAGYLQSLYNSSGVGTYYFQPTITVKVNGTVSKSVTGPVQSVTFYHKLTFGDPRMTVDYTDSGTGNATGPSNATGSGNTSIKLYTLKRNTINALAAPQTNLWGLNGKSYDGTIVYDWYYYKQKSGGSGNGPSTHFKDAGPNLPLNQLAKEEPGRYTLYCTISVRNGKGDTVLKSWTDTSGYYCWVDVKSENADYPATLPSFDNFPKAIYFNVTRSGSNFILPAPGQNMFDYKTFRVRKLELYVVDSKNQNRGGTQHLSGDVFGHDGELVSLQNLLNYTVPKFSDYKARWCYYKYTLTERDTNKVYVVYSPTFALQPASSSPQQIVASGKTPLPSNVKVTGQPYSEYWLPDTGTVTLTAELETKNYPLVYGISGSTSVFKWHSVDAGKTLTANANFTQSARIDSADIDANGNLLLKGALSATFKRGSGSSDDYFDSTLPLTGNPTVTVTDRKFDLRSPSDLASLTTQAERINDVTIHPTNVSVAAPTASVTGGRLVPVWNGNTGKYEWGAAPAGEFAENEYRLFSERFDGKAAGDYSNIPASPAPVEITASTATSGATIRWRVTVSDGTGNVISTTDLKPGTASVTYDSDTDYTDTAAAAWTSSNSTLTVAIPTGAEARKLTVQPMAVKTNNSNQITGLTYGAVYEVYTNRAAKATTPTISNVYNGAPTYKVSRDQLAAAEDAFEFASPNIWVGTGGRGDTTYRWYLSRTADERSVDIGTAIPLSEEKTVSGAERDYSVLPLTAQLLRQYCAQSGGSYNDTLYIYAYAQNHDPSATQVQYAEKLMKVCVVEVADFYAMLPVSITGYTGASTVDIYHGQKAPKEMFSITIPLPADKTSHAVRLIGEARSPDGTMTKDQSTDSVRILRDDSPAAGTTYSDYQKRGNYYVKIPTVYYSPDVPHMTVTIDEGKGTATFTVDQGYFPKLDLTSIYVSGIGSYESANMDFEFYWYVKGSYFGPKESATGGNRTETTGTKYTVHRRQYPVSAPTLSFYSGTDASYTGTAEKPIPDAANTAFWGGETPVSPLPGFRQYSGGYDTYGLRPVTVTVGSSDATWVLVRMEYWNETNKWEKLVNSSMVSATGETREYKDGSTTYTLVKPGSTVSLLTGSGAHFGGSTPQFMRIAAYPMGVNAFSDTQGALTDYGRTTPAKQIFVVQPLEGKPVDAATPACSDSSSYDNFTFIARDSSMTEHTFGANGLWTVSDGGTLSYQWKFYDDKTGEYENIAGATKPTLTVTKAQVKAWSEQSGEPHTRLKLEVTNTNTDPKITGNRYVTETYAPTVCYEDNAVTPRVSITSSGKTTFNLGEQGGTLTGAVSNLDELTTPSYAWRCRVTSAVRNDDTVYTAPADTVFLYPNEEHVAGAKTNTLKLYAIDGWGNNYRIDDSWYSMNSGWKCLWDSYKEVTIEYQLAVTEIYTSDINTTSVEGNSNTIAVTIKRPEQSTALSVTQNGTHPVPPYVLRDDQPLTFTALAAAGSYNWACSWEAAAGSGNYNLEESWTGQTLVLTKDDYWNSSPYILCVMTDTYTDPNSGKTLELKTVSDRILVHYIGENAGKPLFTAGNQTVVADPGAKGKSFDGTATSPDFGTITYKWEMVDRVTGLKTALPNTTAVLDLNPYTAETGAWYFTCTATNTRSDGKSASNSWSYELYIRGVTLTAELTEVDAVAEESSEVKLTARVFGLYGSSFEWSKTGDTAWTLSAEDGNMYSYFATRTATATVQPAAGSSGALNAKVTFSCNPKDGSAVKTAAVNLKANVKNFMVVDNAIELTVGEAVPAGTKLTHKGSVTPDTWTVLSYDELDAVGVTVDANGTLSGTPTVPGPYRITVKAAKGSATATGIVTVYVKIPERDKINRYATVSVGENTSLDADKDHSGSGWSWDTRTGVLTLDNYTGGRLDASSFDDAPLYIRLRGSSTVTAPSKIAINGPYDKGTVLCGSGDLTVSGGIYLVQRDLDVRGSGKIKLIGTTPERSAVYGKLTVGEKGDVEITSSVDGYTAIEGTLAVNGGKLNITLTGARSKGIAQNRTDTEITGGTATITVKGSGDCRGISGGGVQVSGGKLTVDVEILGDSSRIDTYAVYIPNWSLSVSGGGEFNIIGKQTRYGIYDSAWITVDGGTLNVDVTRTDSDREVLGVRQYSSRECHVKNGGVLNISVNTPHDSAGNAGYAKGFAGDILNVYEGGTATITAKSDWKAESIDPRYIVCNGTINLKAETVNGFAYANAIRDFPVAGKGRLNVNVQGKTAYPFYYVTFMGDDEGNPLIVRAHTRTTAKGGTAYVNYGNVTTKKNVDVVMEVESAASGADAYGLLSGRALSVGHTAGSLTLKTAAGTTLKDQLAPQAYYNAENFAVTGDWKGKDFVTFTAISADTLLISNTSGGAVTLYQNTALSSDSSRLTFTAKGGTEPYNWALTGTLPASMSLSGNAGKEVQITGTPTAVGTFPVTLTVTDSSGKTASAEVTITVDAANLVMKEDTTTGIFQGSKLYLPLNSDWATNTHGDEYLYIKSMNGAVSKLTAEVTGVLKGRVSSYDQTIRLWRSDDAVAPKVGDTGTITVKLLNAANSEIAVYTYEYEFVRNNPRYLTVGSEKFPAMLGDSSGTGLRGTWSWDCATSTLTLDNYKCQSVFYPVRADREFPGLTVRYKGNVELAGMQFFSGENLPGLTYKALNDSAALTMSQRMLSGTSTNCVAADITFDGGNVTLYPLYRPVGPEGTAKITVKDVKQFLLSGSQLYSGVLGSDAVVPQYTTDYWLYRNDDHEDNYKKMLCCGTAVPTLDGVEIRGPSTVSQSGSIALTAQVFPMWLPDAKKYSSANAELGKAFEITYTWDPNIGTTAETTVSASTLFGTTPAVGAEKTVKCTARLKLGGSSSATVTSADHTVTVVADGVTVSGQVRSYNPGTSLYVTLYEAGTDTVVNRSHIGPLTGTSGQIPRPFSFKSVPKGTYDLVVTKDAHLKYTVKNVVVGDTDLDLTSLTDEPYSTITLLCGDINGDGSINADDLNIVWNAANFNKSVGDAKEKLTDINGDGSVNADDLNIVWNAANFNKGLNDCTFEF